MEGLLRLSGRSLIPGVARLWPRISKQRLTNPGILDDDGNGQTDLDMLEKRLAEHKQPLSRPSKSAPSLTDPHPTTSLQNSPDKSREPTPRNGSACPELPSTNRDDE